MAFRLRGVAAHQENDDQPADDRHQHDQRTQRARRLEPIGVVDERQVPIEGKVVHKGDEPAERGGADAGGRPDHQRKEREDEQA